MGWKKVSLAVLSTVGLAVLGAVAWIEATWDRTYDVPYPPLTASTNPQVVERGRYLVHGPAYCAYCHVGSAEEVLRVDAGEELPMRGGWGVRLKPLATLTAANLTSDPETGIGRFSDAELFRMLRHNVMADGRPSLAPLMPFSHMADDDLVAIVSYLRANGRSVRNDVAPSRWTFVGRAVIAFGMLPVRLPVVGHEPPPTAPPAEPTVERGRYLAHAVANCMACHSPLDPTTGQMLGPEFSGNPNAEAILDEHIAVRTPNLTPDPTGVLLGFPTESSWIERFRAGRIHPASFMPWGPFSRMSDADLIAIYRYLHTLPPVAHDVGPILVAVEDL